MGKPPWNYVNFKPEDFRHLHSLCYALLNILWGVFVEANFRGTKGS